MNTPFGIIPDDVIELALRLLAAVVAGMLLGLNRDVNGKPTGMRTLGLVSLGAALVSVTAQKYTGLEAHPDASSRVLQGVIQGVLTGVGFIGAGAILHNRQALDVLGLTTAATVWVTAGVGIAAGLGAWWVTLGGTVLGLGLLTLPSLEKKPPADASGGP